MNAVKWKNALCVVLVIVILVFVVNWFLEDKVFTINFVINCFETSVTVITILTWLFCTYFWKFRIFQQWLVLIPDLSGEWSGGIGSNWVNPETCQKIPSIKATLTVKQSLFKISCVVKTEESSSQSTIANFVIDSDNQKSQLIYTYQNDPKQTIQDRSHIHYGTVVFDIRQAKNAILIEGNYWTNRNTSGCIAFSSRQKPKKKNNHKTKS